MTTPTITLAMIVKDEAHIIERCLESIRPYVSRVIIHDTGSTDDTIDVVCAYLERNSIRGYITCTKWVDFGHNRSAVLQDARIKSDDNGYTLMLDADEVFTDTDTNLHAELDALTCDTYQMQVHQHGSIYKRNFFFKNTRDWRFDDPLHEYANVDGTYTIGCIQSAHIDNFHDGARSKDTETYRKDVALLERLKERTPRQQFYLAQSYKDAHEIDAAVAAYKQRIDIETGWWQERFYSYYMIGRLTRDPKVLIEAYALDPRRAEPLVIIGKIYMDERNYDAAEMYLREATQKTLPKDALFVEEDMYTWRSMMEYAVCLYYREDYFAADTINTSLLEMTLPAHAREQVRKNLVFCKQKIDASPHE